MNNEPSLTSSPDTDPSRPRNAKGHRLECLCILCKRIQDAIAAGKPSKADARASARLAREARAKSREKSLSESKRAKADEKRLKAALVQGAMAGQIAAGAMPSIEKAAEIAGISVAKARNAAPKDLVQDALERNGITDDRLYELAQNALDAKNYKVITDSDGNVIETVAIPDWQNRHRFWRDLLAVKGHLGSDREMAATGGLMIIVPDQARVVPGHPPACNCEQCIAAWNERTKKISQQALRSMARDAEIAKNPNSIPATLDDADDE